MKTKVLVVLVLGLLAGGIYYAARFSPYAEPKEVSPSEVPNALGERAAPTGAMEPSVRAGSRPNNAAARVDPSLKVELDGLVLKDHLPDLAERARKNPSLAYALTRALAQCAIRKTAYDALAKTAAKSGNEAAIQRQSENLDKIFAKCRGLDGSEAALQFELAGIAARANILEAQVEYGALAGSYAKSEAILARPEIIAQYRNNVIDFTHRAAATGDPRGLLAAYGLYANGFFVPVDKVRAYRYLAAYANANPSQSTRDDLARFAAQLTPEELSQATRD